MAQFTFIELHFEEGSIPGAELLPREFGADGANDESEDADTSGPSLAKPLFGVLVAVVAFVLARKLLGDEGSIEDAEDVIEETIET